MDSKKCWCYLTYVFPVAELPPLPVPKPDSPTIEGPAGFEPEWFLKAKFPEDED